MYFDFQKRIFVIGSPRSGTTWLAKILDSHEKVIYRHEPDSLLFSEVPYFPEEANEDQWVEKFICYLNDLANVRYPKSACSLPDFQKAYRSERSQRIRKLVESFVRAFEYLAEKVPAKTKSLNVPDLLSGKLPAPDAIVIKSVDSIGRMHLLKLTDPETKIVHLLRHPCAFVASQLRGQELSKMKIETFPTTQIKLAGTLGKSLNLEALNQYSMEQKLASLWMLHNENLFARLETYNSYKLIIYEHLCEDPILNAKELFDFVELNWSEQTEKFINQSLKFKGDDAKYFQVIRNPKDSVNKWKRNLTEQQIKDVISVVEGSLVYEKFYGQNAC